jgi:hypothetical protein
MFKGRITLEMFQEIIWMNSVICRTDLRRELSQKHIKHKRNTSKDII